MDAFADAIREGARSGITPLRPLAIAESRVAPDIVVMEVVTADGIIVCLRHGLDAGEDATTLYLGGALGGLSGPAHGLYHKLGRKLGGVRVHYRKPGHLEDCLFDVLLVHHLLARRGVERVALVGHSFGGGVALGAGVLLGPATAGVVALSTQVPGTEAVDRLVAPVLLVHGDSDGVLPDLCSRNVYERATSARKRDLVVLPGEGHLLDGQAAAGLEDQVAAFLGMALAGVSA